jgi:hypothetical protein
MLGPYTLHCSVEHNFTLLLPLCFLLPPPPPPPHILHWQYHYPPGQNLAVSYSSQARTWQYPTHRAEPCSTYSSGQDLEFLIIRLEPGSIPLIRPEPAGSGSIILIKLTPGVPTHQAKTRLYPTHKARTGSIPLIRPEPAVSASILLIRPELGSILLIKPETDKILLIRPELGSIKLTTQYPNH